MSEQSAENPRAVPGGNAPLRPDPEQVGEWLKAEYADLVAEVDRLLDEARVLPKEVTSDEDVGNFGVLVNKLRDVKKQLGSHREAEKAPYMRTEETVDQFFFAQIERVERRKKTDRPGAVDVLMDRVDRFNQAKLAAERAAREKADREAREAARKAQEEADRIAREQRELEEKAARARKAENKEAAEAAARELEEKRAEADRIAEQERQRADEARMQATAKSADMVRTRHDTGVLSTMKRVPYVEIVDKMKLDPAALWPFVTDDDALKALKAWAKSTGHAKSMAGAIVEMRDKTDLR